METDEDLYHAAPQAKGKAAQATVNKRERATENLQKYGNAIHRDQELVYF